MKANELMIGDWVMIETYSKICAIAEDGVYFEDKDGRGATSFDRIEPIPLTAEILEKNGFDISDKCCSFKDNYCSISIYLDRIEDEEIDNASIFLEGALFDMHININYVHELQHALRLCGVDKEIVL